MTRSRKFKKAKLSKRRYYDIHDVRRDICERTGIKNEHQVWLWLVGCENANGVITYLPDGKEPYTGWESPEHKLVVETCADVYGEAEVKVWW